MKVLFGLVVIVAPSVRATMTTRQTTGFVTSLLELAGLNWPVPDFSTLCRRQRTLAVQLPYRGSGRPLHLLIDSTGIKVHGEGEWHARKHGGARRRARHCPRTDGGQVSRRKVHLAVDEATLEVRAVEITGSGVGDAPMLPGLLDQIPADEPIASVTADGAYDGRACRNAMASRSADALAIVLEPLAHKARSRQGATMSRGRKTAPARGRGTTPCAPSNGSGEPSGAAGAATTAVAASRPR
jgi:hypothetical protein